MKKIYLALLALTLGVTANAQRNLKLDFQIIKPAYDTNLVTGSTLTYQYRVTNNSATTADSVQKGDTVSFFDPSCKYNPAATTAIKFTSYVYFVATTSLPKGSSITVTPTTPLAFSSIETLAELATLPTLSYKLKPFVDNKQYAWFVILYSVSKPAANIAIASLSGNADTGRIWINKGFVGIDEISFEEVIKTYPNPAANTLSFEYNISNEKATATILDIAGRTILVKELASTYGTQKVDLDITSIQNGQYFLRLNVGEKTITGKFNVQK